MYDAIMSNIGLVAGLSIGIAVMEVGFDQYEIIINDEPQGGALPWAFVIACLSHFHIANEYIGLYTIPIYVCTRTSDENF